MPTQAEIRQEITHRILDAFLFGGIVPWKKPWRNDPNSGSPTNVVSKKRYSGVNPLLLDLVAMTHGYQSRWWGTFQQWKDLGANVKKRPADVPAGRWGTQIVFWKQITKTKTAETDPDKTFPLLRYYTVFNVDQVEGEVVDRLRASNESPSSPLDADYQSAHEAIKATGADIRHGGDRAYYVRPQGDFGDFISIPNPSQFDSPHKYYSTMFHELAHWSECRVDWKGSYAMGELVAEIAASFLCAHTNIPCADGIDGHTSYLASWLKEFEDDDRAIMQAASQASKAADFILDFSRKTEPAELLTTA